MAERQQQWRRDKQIEAYADFVGAGADLNFAVDRLQNSGTDSQRAENMTELKAAVVRFSNAYNRVLIVAHPAVRPLAVQIVARVQDIGEAIDKEPLDDKAIDQLLVAAAELRQQLSEEARKQLGFDD